MLRLTIVAAVASLVVAGTASAGGWATAGVSPPPPDDPSGGSTWNTDITIKQHGVTPLDNITPAVILRNTATGEEQQFEIQLNVSNLFDKDYVGTINSAGTGNSGDRQTLLVGAPRQFFATLKAGF